MKQELRLAKRFGDGARIALYGRIVKVQDKEEWWVFSETDADKHYVVKEDKSCNCPDFQFRGIQCKHSYGVDLRYNVVRTLREIA